MTVLWRSGIAGLLVALASAVACQGSYPAGMPGGAGGGAGSGGSGGAGCASDDDCGAGQVCRIECPCESFPPSCCHGVCVPELAACVERGRDACGADGRCRWLVPGCGDRPLPYEGCFPAEDCRAAGCEAGRACVDVWVDPCDGEPCMIAACGEQTAVCLEPQLPCDGATVDAQGACRGPDGEERDVACCTWDCDLSKVLCKRTQPQCPPGETPSVIGLCYGPCVPVDRCLPTDAAKLCEATGGRWDEGGCGHTICGESVVCVRAEPGCHCGPLEVFDEQRGCTIADRCLCTGTGGTWEEWACGDRVCGVPNMCEAIIPGCDCGALRVFEHGKGCALSAECFAGEGDPCGPGKTCLDGLWCVGGVCARKASRCDQPKEVCELMSSCRWYVPGCGENPLPAAGCFEPGDCAEMGCPEGRTCTKVSIDPCFGLPCDACGMEVALCLPGG